jgi:hypothetical protein
MPLGYKYAERQADSYVNWATIGKGLTDSLYAEAQLRRDKIKAIEDQNIADIDELENAPQGKFQDANKFTNDFAHDMKAQTLIDKRLLESGLLSERQYTLKRQNRVNGTSTLFDLQKKYQEVYDKRMEGIQSGDLQAMNIANLKMIESFKDFSQSKAIINPLDGTVNIGIMKPNPNTGILELTKEVMPVNVAMNKISTEIPTFKVDDEMNNSVKAFGSRKDALYSAASIVKAGSIRELVGIDALKKYPQYADVITDFNKALDGTISSYFSNQYHLTSVLTENLGKYNEDSYTYDKSVADADPNKILVKIDGGTGLPVLDQSSKNYASQRKEAEAWVRDQIMSKLDRESSVTTTNQLNQLRPKPQMEQWQYDEGRRRNLASNLAQQIKNVTSGNANEVDKSLRYFAGKGVKVERYKDRLEIYQKDKDGNVQKIPYYFSRGGQIANPLEFGKSLISAVDSEGLGEDYVASELPKYFGKNSTINTETSGSGYARVRDTKKAFANKANTDIVTSDLFLNKDKFSTISDLKTRLSGIPGLTIESVPSGSYTLSNGRYGNEIVIKYGKDAVTVDTYKTSKKSAINQKKNLLDFLQKLPEAVQEQFLGEDLTEQEARSAEEGGVNYRTK